MLEDMQVRRLSPFTQRTYVETVARFARYFDRYPERLGPEHIRELQLKELVELSRQHLENVDPHPRESDAERLADCEIGRLKTGRAGRTTRS